MVTMNGKTMKKRKLIMFLGALFLALTLSAGTYAYTFSIATTALDVTAAGSGIVTTQPAPSQDQPEWDEVLPQSEADQEILRPDGPGSQTGINSQYPSGGAHWDKVDDVTPDDWSTYIYTMTKQDNMDLYSISDHIEGVNAITGVSVFFRIASQPAGTYAYASAAIRTGGANYQGTQVSHLGDSFATYSYTWGNNPNTGSPWTWSEIDTLQAGIVMAKQPDASLAACTQVFVVVDYELPPIIEGQAPAGDMFIVTPQAGYTGDLLMNIYVMNTGPLRLAYRYLNLKLYVANSLEALETPNYQTLSLENGVVTFNIEGGSAASYTVSVVGGSYALISGDASEWGAGWDHIPELYCEVVQR